MWLHSVFFIFSLHQTYFDQSDTLQTYLSLALTMQTMKECIPYVLEGWNTSGHNVTSRIRIIQTFFWETCNGIVLKKFNKFKLRAWYEESVSANYVDNICQSVKVSRTRGGGGRVLHNFTITGLKAPYSGFTLKTLTTVCWEWHKACNFLHLSSLV